MKDFVVYIRVSTRKQGTSGLGLEAQRKICADFIKNNNGEQVAEFMDVESGTNRDRRGLLDAVDYCKSHNCALVCAKLDRLARDVEFCFKVVNTGIEIHFVDMPTINTLLLGVFAAVAQYERELTSERTTKALAAKKARGEKMGGAAEKWKESYNNKSKEQLDNENMERGRLKNEHYLQSKEVKVFMKILKNVFPDECNGDDYTKWHWGKINTSNGAKDKIIALMKDYRDMDESGSLFGNFDFNETDKRKMQVRLCAKIQNIRVSVNTKIRIEEELKINN